MIRKKTIFPAFILSLFFIFSCGHYFTDKGRQEILSIKKNYSCSHVTWSVDYSARESAIIVDLCGCAGTLNIDSVSHHKDLVKKIGEDAYRERLGDKKFDAVIVRVSKDSTNDAVKGYRYTVDANGALVFKDEMGNAL